MRKPGCSAAVAIAPMDMRLSAAGTVDRRHRTNPEIEYLRALAILFVIVKHVPLLCIPYPAGWVEGIQAWIDPETGVDLFFIISGYLIGRSFMCPFEAAEHRGRAHQVARIAAFWVRRFYRLFPASTLWVGLAFAASMASRNHSLWLTPHVMFTKAIATLAVVRNFEESRAPSYFGYYWSLSVENQFYLALPVLLLAVRRRWRFAGLCALCAMNAVWRPGGTVWWMFRYDGLIYGLLLFELERSGLGAILSGCLPRTSAGRGALLTTVGAVVLGAPLALAGYPPLAWSVVNWAGFVLVFAASCQVGAIAIIPGLRRAMLWIGARSYSLYLCHIPVWFAVIDLSEQTGLSRESWVPVRMVIGILASLVAADLTFRWLELPLQERGRVRASEIRRANEQGQAGGLAISP